MTHKTLVDGTSFEVSAGKTLVDGTAFDIGGGKALVDGTGYEVGFKPLITFYVEGDRYVSGSPCIAEEGMTWAEWIESDYNNLMLSEPAWPLGSTPSTGKCELIGNYVGYATRSDYRDTIVYHDTQAPTMYGGYVKSSDYIIDGYTYTAQIDN